MSIGEMSESAICFAAEQIQNRLVQAISNMDLPHVRMRPRLSRDGNKWIACYGDNLQEGVVGIGESPGEAMFHFDNEWDKRIEAGETEKQAGCMYCGEPLGLENQHDIFDDKLLAACREITGE